MTVCLVWALKRAERLRFPLQLTIQLTGWLLIVIPLGARLLHVVYEEPAYYWESPLRVLEVWKGGFVFYGGLLAGLIFGFVFFRLQKQERTFAETADFMTPVMNFGTGFGRIACFLQYCCYGKAFDGLWSVKGRHPTQLYMFFWEMGILAVVVFLEKHHRSFLKKNTGFLFSFWLGSSALGRFLIEFYRDDFRGQFFMNLSISQWISLGLAVGAASFLIGPLRLRAKH